MPLTEVLLYRDDDGSCPLNDWLDSLQPKPQDKCLAKLARLEEEGADLRRPEAENLGNGLYELRVRFGHVNYRMLYFFHGQDVAVVSHGITKEKIIPQKEIAFALARKKKFERDPRKHTFHREE